MRTKAFTLIEVLLAVAIFGVVLLAIHSIFHGALRLRNRTTQAVEDALPLERALATLRRDLANVVAPNGTLSGTFTTLPTTTDGLLSQPLLQFHASVGILTDVSPWAEIQRIAYALSAPTNLATGRDLRRIVTRNLLALSDSFPEEQVLLQGVDALQFSFFDGSAWKDTWDGTNEVVALPRAVRVSLTLVDTNILRAATRPQPIELVVGLLVEPATNAAPAATTGGGS